MPMPCPSMWHCKVLPSARQRVRHLVVACGCLLVLVFIASLVIMHVVPRADAAMTPDDSSLRYGVTIDLGSSGSRVFVYVWPPHSGRQGELLDIRQLRDNTAEPVIMKIEPGISSLALTPSEASDHVRPLLAYAARHVPLEKQSATPLYIMATAGVRLLSGAHQEALLADLRTDVGSDCGFLFAPSHADIITGKQEAVYTWVAVNYALGRLHHRVLPPGESRMNHSVEASVGVVDMGGASLQVAYEVSPKTQDSESVVANDLAEFSLGCTSSDVGHYYRIYVATFLGYGGNSARSRYDLLLSKGNASGVVLRDPCRPVDLVDGDNATRFIGSGDFAACRRAIVPLLNLSATCLPPRCSLGGATVPRPRTQHAQFYGLSELFYSSDDVLGLNGPYDYEEFTRAAKEFCATPWMRLKVAYQKGSYPRASWHRLKSQCFKSAWVATVLHQGLALDTPTTPLTVAQRVGGDTVQWTLGALLFRTRYFPLREIERLDSSSRRPFHLRHSSSPHFIFFLIFAAFVIAVVVHRRRRASRARIHRVPTMSFFMTDEDQLEDGVLIDKTSPPPFYR